VILEVYWIESDAIKEKREFHVTVLCYKKLKKLNKKSRADEHNNY
jgi:hypothetical protein